MVFPMEVKMLLPALILFGLPTGPSAVLDLTADFTSLLIGLWVIVGLCLLGLGVTAATHDAREESHQDTKTPDHPTLVTDWPDAA